jgi:hypothetical protein
VPAPACVWHPQQAIGEAPQQRDRPRSLAISDERFDLGDDRLRARIGVGTGEHIIEQPLGARDRLVRYQHFVTARHSGGLPMVHRGRTAQLKLQAPAMLGFRRLQPELERAQLGESHGEMHRDLGLARSLAVAQHAHERRVPVQIVARGIERYRIPGGIAADERAVQRERHGAVREHGEHTTGEVHLRAFLRSPR